MRPEEKKNTFIAGVFLAFLILLTLFFTMMLSKENSLFDRKIELFTKVHNAQNLKPGAAVKLKGIKIGTVEKIDFKTHDQIIINMSVIDRFIAWIKEDSFISIKTQGVLGDKYIEILGGTDSSASIKEKSFIKTQKSKELTDLFVEGQDILVTANRAIMKIEQVLDDLNHERTISLVSKNLAETSVQMKRFFAPENVQNFTQMANNLSTVTQNLNLITTQIQNGPGNIHSFVYDNSLYEDVRTLLGGAQRNRVLKYFIRESIKKSETLKE